MSTHVSSWWKLDFEWLISVGSFGSLPNVRMKNKTSECIKFGCERSDAIYERSDTNREQWFRIRIPKSELWPISTSFAFRKSHAILCFKFASERLEFACEQSHCDFYLFAVFDLLRTFACERYDIQYG